MLTPGPPRCHYNAQHQAVNQQGSSRADGNPHAAHLFAEEGEEYAGKRLTLTVLREETDIEKIQSIRRRSVPSVSEEGMKYLVYFHIDGMRPLIGAE